MSTHRTLIAASVALLAALALTACSKPAQPASQAGQAADDGAAPTAPTPPAGVIKLDIKDASGAQLSGDPAAGQQVFMQCMTCHSLDSGVNRVGPSLHAIVGRHSGAVPGFSYSNANKTSGIVWTEQALYTYLESPQKTIPGTYMTYAGVKDPQKRADVIAYLQDVTK
jgi:cytochrome c